MYRILVVDDEKIERKGVMFLFKQMDIECEIVEIVNVVSSNTSKSAFTVSNDVNIVTLYSVAI